MSRCTGLVSEVGVRAPSDYTGDTGFKFRAQDGVAFSLPLQVGVHRTLGPTGLYKFLSRPSHGLSVHG